MLLAEVGAAGSTPGVAAIHCEALVIGAGPVGLWQVFQLGLQGIAAHVVDALPQPGGQCIALYPDKPIYDIPGVPLCTGRELTERLMQQVRPFAPRLHMGQQVSTLQRRDDDSFDVATTSGQAFVAATVFIAGGVGAFQPKQLALPGADALTGHSLFYEAPAPATLVRHQVLVLGGEDGAVQLAIDLAEAATPPASITLLHRRATLTAEPALLARLQPHIDAGQVRFDTGQIVALETAGQPQQLAAVQVVGSDDNRHRVPVDALIVQLGISPKLGPITQWGLAMARRQLVVDPAHCETSTPGIYAVGDVVHYPGKKKLILCGFHEATLAAFAATARLRPDAPVLLQYTTTSTRLHQRLGVATTGAP